MFKEKRVWLWHLMMAIGILCTLFLLAGRISAEGEDKNVSAAFFLSDVEELAEKSGLPLSDWLAVLSEAGVEHLIVGTDFLVRSEVRTDLALTGNEPMDGPFSFRLPEEGSPLVAS